MDHKAPPDVEIAAALAERVAALERRVDQAQLELGEFRARNESLERRIASLEAQRAGLDGGRRKANERARQRGTDSRRAVEQLAADYLALGRPRRALAGLIARRLHGLLSRRQVQRILATLSSVST